MNDNELVFLNLEELRIMGLHAKNPNVIGYINRWFLQANLPYNEVKGNVYRRKFGNWTLSIINPDGVGLPFGVIPRLLINWVLMEAFTKKEKKIILDDQSLDDFLRKLDILKEGHVYKHFHDQMQRIFGSVYGISYDDKEMRFTKRHTIWIANRERYYWDQSETDEKEKNQSYIILSDSFYSEVAEYPTQISLEALKALKDSPMALDLYAWLTCYLSFLRSPMLITWEQIHNQFGASNMEFHDFEGKFVETLKRVQKIYPQASMSFVDWGGPRKGLLLNPFPSQG